MARRATSEPESLTIDLSTFFGSAWQASPKPLRITELVYSCSCKINLGNYESVDLFTSAKAPVDSDQSPDAAYDELRTWVRDKVRQDKGEITQKLANRITEPQRSR